MQLLTDGYAILVSYDLTRTKQLSMATTVRLGFNCVVSKKVSSFTVHKGGKFITHNVSYSESELDARLWKKNLKTQ